MEKGSEELTISVIKGGLLEMPEGAEEALKGDANEDKPKKRKSKGTKKTESPAAEDDASQDA